MSNKGGSASRERRRIRREKERAMSELKVLGEPDLRNVVESSVQEVAIADVRGQSSGNFLFTVRVAEAADRVIPWGVNVRTRDKQLRDFITTEPYIMSAIFTVATSRASLSYRLKGPPRTVRQVKRILLNANMGAGWSSMIMQLAIDVLTQDNGGFLEIIRYTGDPKRIPVATDPIVGLAYLDAAKCVRTGDPYFPVLFDGGKETKLEADELGGMRQVERTRWHKLAAHQVIMFEEMPSPHATTGGIGGAQYCFLSRVLAAAYVIRSMSRHKDEKVSGRFTKAIHLVGGVAKQEIDDATIQAHETADNQGLMSYMQPIIMAALDPNASVQHVEIPLASLPDGFDEDSALKWYIALLAIGSGEDYQTFAPLPGGNLGTASQSDILRRKTRGKGPGLWKKLVINKLSQARVIPGNVEMSFEEDDLEDAAEMAALRKARAEERAIRIASLEITPAVARQIAADDGDLDPRLLAMLGEEDATDTLSVSDDETDINY